MKVIRSLFRSKRFYRYVYTMDHTKEKAVETSKMMEAVIHEQKWIPFIKRSAKPIGLFFFVTTPIIFIVSNIYYKRRWFSKQEVVDPLQNESTFKLRWMVAKREYLEQFETIKNMVIQESIKPRAKPDEVLDLSFELVSRHNFEEAINVLKSSLSNKRITNELNLALAQTYLQMAGTQYGPEFLKSLENAKTHALACKKDLSLRKEVNQVLLKVAVSMGDLETAKHYIGVVDPSTESRYKEIISIMKNESKLEKNIAAEPDNLVSISRLLAIATAKHDIEKMESLSKRILSDWTLPATLFHVLAQNSLFLPATEKYMNRHNKRGAGFVLDNQMKESLVFQGLEALCLVHSALRSSPRAVEVEMVKFFPHIPLTDLYPLLSWLFSTGRRSWDVVDLTPRDPNLAIHFLNNTHKSYPEYTATIYYRLATMYMMNGDMDRAYANLMESRKLSPSCPLIEMRQTALNQYYNSLNSLLRVMYRDLPQ